MLNVSYTNFYLFLMVFSRISGMILFNPVLNRKNVPGPVKAGFSFVCAILLTGSLNVGEPVFNGTLIFLLSCIKEMIVGFVVGYIISLFLSALLMAGQMMDNQMGFSMASLYDPATNINVSVSGNLFNLMFLLVFVLSNGISTLFQIMIYSFHVFPPGAELIASGFSKYILLLFSDILVMAVKIALPVIAAELIGEFGIGVLMRTVPQINVFVVGLQAKVLIGLAVLILLVPVVADILDSMQAVMFEKIGYAVKLTA